MTREQKTKKVICDRSDRKIKNKNLCEKLSDGKTKTKTLSVTEVTGK
jgi:hypothetical protein